MLRQWYRSWKKKKEEKRLAQEEKRLHPLRVAFYRSFIQPGELVFDVGANTGNRIDAFLDAGARVLAVEPQPACIQILEEKFGNRISIVTKGLSAEPGTTEMFIADASTISSLSEEFIEKTGQTRFRRNTWKQKITIQLTTLDQLIQQYGLPVFCKIDVEGFEENVLKGLHQPLPALSFEYCTPEMHEQIGRCCALLAALDPNYQFNYSTGESMQWAGENWYSYDEFIRVIDSAAFKASLFGDIYCKQK